MWRIEARRLVVFFAWESGRSHFANDILKSFPANNEELFEIAEIINLGQSIHELIQRAVMLQGQNESCRERWDTYKSLNQLRGQIGILVG